MKSKLCFLNASCFLQTQIFILPVLFLFYQHCGLTVGDFFLFQGIFSLSALLFEIPMGYLADVFSKRNVLILSYTFFLIRLLLWLFLAQYGYWILLIGEILYAAQKASFAGVADSYIYEYLKFNHISDKMKKHYGTMNFFMSFGTAFSSLVGASVYAIISQYTLKEYNYNYGFMALLGLELILNLTAIGLLFRLPQLPYLSRPQLTLKQTYNNLFRCIVWTMKNKNIKDYMFYSSLLVSITSVFAWGFQPIMKLLLFPVSLYGIVYSINHIFRAICSLCSDKINRFISLPKMAILIFVLFVICFILTFIVLNVPSLPIGVSLLYFIFVSLTIGGQLAFKILHESRLHTFIPSKMRATASSINTMIGRLYSGFFFILMKVLLDGASLQKSLAICFTAFVLLAFPLRKVCLEKIEK